jgi:hypothetical protein
MDHVSARDAMRSGAHDRRWRMREQARTHRSVQAPASDHYQTPEWLERSFVLPLSKPEASDVPSQPVRRHDDDPAPEPRLMANAEAAAEAATPGTTSAPLFVRPPTADVDFARVVRRSEMCRTVTRVHWAATGLAGIALLVFLLMDSTAALAAVVGCAAVAIAAFGVRVWLHRAPVPTVQR